jgi:hypothetical protein
MNCDSIHEAGYKRRRHEVRRQVILAKGTPDDITLFDAGQLDDNEEYRLREEFLFPGLAHMDLSRITTSEVDVPALSVQQRVGARVLLEFALELPSSEGWELTTAIVGLCADKTVVPGMLVEAEHPAGLYAYLHIALTEADEVLLQSEALDAEASSDEV